MQKVCDCRKWRIRHSYILVLVVTFLTQGLASNLRIEFSGNNFFSSAYLMAKSTRIENDMDIVHLIQNILTKYSNAGFPFCRISPEIVYQNQEIEKIILKIDEGEKVIISDCLFNIRGKTEIAAVKKIVHLRIGDYFSAKEITRSKNLLLKTGAFENISDNIVSRDGNYYLLFNITEKRSDYVTALGSLAENNLNFGITFYSLNLLGTLRQLQFRYEYQKLFSLQFTEPILIAPSVFNVDFSLWTYDSARLTQLKGKFTTPLGYYFNISLTTGVEAVSYYTNVLSTPQKVDNLLGLGLSQDYETSSWTCRQEISFEFALRKFDRYTIEYDGEINLGKFHIKPHYYWVKTDSFEYFDYFRVGGSKNLRGYLEEEFIVLRALWLNIEYRKFFVFPLFDFGLMGDALKFSYGFGITTESDFANASLALAWPRDGNWRDGKVHIMFEKGL